MLSPRKNTRSGSSRRPAIRAATASCPCVPHSENPSPYPESPKKTSRTSPFCARSGGHPRSTASRASVAAAGRPGARAAPSTRAAAATLRRFQGGSMASEPHYDAERQVRTVDDVPRVEVEADALPVVLPEQGGAERDHGLPALGGE